MKKPLTVVVLTIPLYGHTNPMLGLAKALVHQGHKVKMYSTQEFKAAILATGASFKSAPAFEQIERFTPNVGKDPLKIAELVLDLTEEQLDTVITMLEDEKADIVLHDGFCLWAKTAARAVGIPAVSVITTMVLTPALIRSFPGIAWEQISHLFSHFSRFWKIVQRHKRLNKLFQLKSRSIFDMFINEEPLNIVFTSRYFQPQSKSISQAFLFIGPSLSGRNVTEKEKNDFKTKQPLIYISLGTIFNNDPQFYHICIDAFANAPYNVIISVGTATDLQVFKSLPENIRVRSHVNQVAILKEKEAAVFVSHGGMNSVNESMYYGVPMVFFPAVQEQMMNSLRVQQLGAGKVMNRDGLTKEELLKTVSQIVEDESYKKNAQEVQRSLKEAEGIDIAIKKIESLVP